MMFRVTISSVKSGRHWRRREKEANVNITKAGTENRLKITTADIIHS